MTRTVPSCLLIAALLAAFLAPAALAETYTVTLNTGQVFESRYQPQEAEWDTETVLLMTDVGNWIALPLGLIESVVSASESRGYGIRLDATTLLLGISANDAPAPGEEGYEEPSAAAPSTPSFFDRSFDIQQFVEPSEAGGGIPVYGISVSPVVSEPNG